MRKFVTRQEELHHVSQIRFINPEALAKPPGYTHVVEATTRLENERRLAKPAARPAKRPEQAQRRQKLRLRLADFRLLRF